MSTSASSDDRPLRWAIVGIGRHTRRFIGPAIAASRLGVLAAVCSSRPDEAADVSRDWGQPAVYASYDELLGCPGVDALFLVSPNNLHKDQVTAAAAAGKHVLCEKPLASTPADCQEMVQACAKAGVALGVGFHLRHNIVHERAREIVASGQLGEVTFVSARYAHATGGSAPAGPPPAWRRDPGQAGGGSFIGTGVHAIDLLRSVTGAEVTAVTVAADDNGIAYGEQNLLASAKLSNGAIASIHGGNLPYPANELVICGTAGTVRCTGSVGNYGGGLLELITADGEEAQEVERHNVYARECDDFVARVRAGEDPNASGVDGLRCAEVTVAIYASARTGALTSIPALG
ncbi:MAG TPA: Gfo/Idh/MocA family oxidoreductase [Streptosporangiaceae bacterium]|nr:Gfo/Idh/MocA family oxidoreductase [Streptosporangiaceae bacterium]